MAKAKKKTQKEIINDQAEEILKLRKIIEHYEGAERAYIVIGTLLLTIIIALGVTLANL